MLLLREDASPADARARTRAVRPPKWMMPAPMRVHVQASLWAAWSTASLVRCPVRALAARHRPRHQGADHVPVARVLRISDSPDPGPLRRAQLAGQPEPPFPA